MTNCRNLFFVNCYTSDTETESSKFLSEGIRCVRESRRTRKFLIEKKLFFLNCIFHSFFLFHSEIPFS